MIKHRKNFLHLVFCGIFAALVVLRPGYADYDDSDCQAFSPAFVLCSVHSHNVGYESGTSDHKPANPTAAEQVADMNEVIALKATVIAQQLKKQYDALNSVIKRFKTQLEKSVWQSKIEIVTGTSSSDSGGASGSAGAGLAGAQDCDMVTDMGLVYDCIIGNLQKVQGSNDTKAARAQLIKDIEVANGLGLCFDGDKSAVCYSDADKTAIKSQGSKDIKNKATDFSRKLRSAKNTYNNNLSRNRYGR